MATRRRARSTSMLMYSSDSISVVDSTSTVLMGCPSAVVCLVTRRVPIQAVGDCLHLIFAGSALYPAGLTAPARVHLRFYHPCLPTECAGALGRSLSRARRARPRGLECRNRKGFAWIGIRADS